MAKNVAVAAPPKDDWQAKSDMNTLLEAERIKGDGKRHGAARAHANAQLEAMRKVGQPLDQATVEGKEKGKPDGEDRAEAKKAPKK